MALFKKRPAAGGPDAAVVAFWDWWTAEGHSLAEQSIAGTLDREVFAATMDPRVQSLGELGWELAKGELTEHVLIISAEGDPDRRGAARRVVLAAPEADTTWSYVDSRPPVADPEEVLLSTVGAPDIDFARIRVAARMDNGRFDVQVHHPAFADLPEDGRAHVALLAMDAALGEIDTELWLNEISSIEFPPLDGFGLNALRAVVDDLKRQRLDQDGRPGWLMLRGETPQGPLVAMARSPLHALTAPHLDTYVALVLPYAHRTPDGLPDRGSLEPLRELEGRLERVLGTSGQVVAHLNTNGTRTLHLYVDSTAGLLPAVKDLAKSWDQGKADVHDMHDPAWQAVRHLNP
jgi:hypothetical protein